jgi:hypothetical protein
MVQLCWLKSLQRIPMVRYCWNARPTCERKSVILRCWPSSNFANLNLCTCGRLDSITNSADATTASLRFIDYFTIPSERGDCVVLLVGHPGVNQLARYFPSYIISSCQCCWLKFNPPHSSKVNELLLADVSRPKPTPPPGTGDVYMGGIEEERTWEDDASDVMDLASFLE